MQRRCPGRVLVVDLGLTVWDHRSGYKDPFGLCPATVSGAARSAHEPVAKADGNHDGRPERPCLGRRAIPSPPFELPSASTSTAATSSARSSKRRSTAARSAVAKGEGSFFCPNEKPSKARWHDCGVTRRVASTL